MDNFIPMPTADHDYQAGLRDGKIEAIEAMVAQHSKRLNGHEDRFVYLERIIWGLVGAIALMQFYPDLKAWVGS